MRPLLDVVKSGDQIDQRGFSRSRRSDDRDDAAALDAEAHIVNNRLGRVVAEGDVFKGDGARTLGQLAGIESLADGGPGHEHFVQPSGRDHRVLILLVDGRYLLQSAEDRPHRPAEHERSPAFILPWIIRIPATRNSDRCEAMAMERMTG